MVVKMELEEVENLCVFSRKDMLLGALPRLGSHCLSTCFSYSQSGKAHEDSNHTTVITVVHLPS